MKSLLISTIIILCLVSFAETITATSVHDGDTFRSGKQSYRLWGIDTPELDQRWGVVAREALRQLLDGREIEIEQHGTSYRRIVVRCEVEKQDVALELLKMGLAWYCPEFAPRRNDYREAEQEAREARRGLWSDENHVSPAEWRKTGNNVISR